jgi:hypothetical protein
VNDRDFMQADVPTERFFETMMSIPSEVYFYATLGSIVASAVLYFTGRRHTALFVGEWAPTLLGAALFYKLLHPRGQNVGDQLRGTLSEVTR